MLPRFFKHFTSKGAGSSSKYKVLSEVSRTFWRRFLHKSSTSASSRKEASCHKKNFLGSKDLQIASRAPRIDTLNLTRNSIQIEKEHLPRLPSPTHDKGSPPVTYEISSSHVDRDDGVGYEPVADVEKEVPSGWV